MKFRKREETRVTVFWDKAEVDVGDLWNNGEEKEVDGVLRDHDEGEDYF